LASIVRDRDTQRSKGFAFVEMPPTRKLKQRLLPLRQGGPAMCPDSHRSSPSRGGFSNRGGYHSSFRSNHQRGDKRGPSKRSLRQRLARLSIAFISEFETPEQVLTRGLNMPSEHNPKWTEIEGPNAKACHHHWVIEPARSSVSQGVCQICQEVREFKNSIEWQYGQQKPGRPASS
jgi:hypothetical protein